MKYYKKIIDESIDSDNLMETNQKRKRKNKKLNEKQILRNAFIENSLPGKLGHINNPKTMSLCSSREYAYKNTVHLSTSERGSFENKFHTPKNKNQSHYVQHMQDKSKKIVVANGPAGTGKTLFATEHGIKNFIEGKCEKLIFTRPSVSVDEDLGYLPGTLEDKMSPWIRPIYDILYRFFSQKDITQYLEEKVIEIAPLGYMRGRTFSHAWIVADEMQNSTIAQMKMLMTRLGEGSRLIITGDLDQYDKMSDLNGLNDFLLRFKGKRSASISSFEFERNDIQREDVVKEVLEIYGGEQIPDYSNSNP